MKKIIFWAVVIATVIVAMAELFTVGLPEVNYLIMSVSGFILCAGVIYMKLSLYRTQDVVWCVLGGIALTLFVIFGGHLIYCMPLIANTLKLGDLEILLLAFAAAIYIPVVYCISLYFFIFYFCDLKSKVQNIK